VDLPKSVVLAPRVRAFLEAPHFATLGTVGEDGAPHQAVIWYALEADGRILVNSRFPRRWPAELTREPRCSLAIMDEANPFIWVGLAGIVETIVDDVEQARDDIVALAIRYDDAAPEREAAFRSQPRISFRIRVVGVHDHIEDPARPPGTAPGNTTAATAATAATATTGATAPTAAPAPATPGQG
jgi:PPOX class probable F420-dependent enzyme